MMAQKALGFVPTGFTNQETQKDFAEELGDLNLVNQKSERVMANG